MLIESLIKPSRKSTRTVSVHGTKYLFTALANTGRFVAEVNDEAAIAVFKQHPKQFREFTDDLVPSLSKAPAPEKPAAPPKPAAPAKDAAPPEPPAPPAPPAPAADGGGESTAAANADVDAKAQALLSCTPVAIKKQLAKNTPPAVVLERAVAIEQAAKKPRDVVIAAVKGALSVAATTPA